MRLTTFFILILLGGISFLFFHSYSLQSHLELTEKSYIQYADSFANGVKNLSEKSISYVNLEKDFLKALSSPNIEVSKKIQLIDQGIIQEQTALNSEKERLLKELDLLSNEITKDLLPKFSIEKNKTVSLLEEKIPDHLQATFLKVFDTQSINRSQIGLLVNSQNILNDIYYLRTTLIEGSQPTKEKLEFISKINHFRFEEMLKLEIRHLLVLKINRFKTTLDKINEELNSYLTAVENLKEKKNQVLGKLAKSSEKIRQSFYQSQSLAIKQHQSFLKEKFDRIKTEMKFSFFLFAMGLIIAFFAIYLLISKPLSEYIRFGRTKNKSILIEVKKLINRIEEKHMENLELQSDLLKNEKLASIGSLVNLISHELKNPLAIIQLSLDDLMERATDTDLKELKNIELMLNRMNELIKSMNGMGRVRVEEETFDLVELVEKLSDMFRRVFLKNQIVLDIESAQDVIEVCTLRGYLEVILLNLISNAIRAVEEASEKRICIKLQKREDRVEIMVKDTGVGIKPDVASLIFEPYISSKINDGDSGLGLSIVKSSVDRLNGNISVESKPNEGAEFHISF